MTVNYPAIELDSQIRTEPVKRTPILETMLTLNSTFFSASFKVIAKFILNVLFGLKEYT